jgi:hypothetical protein
VISAAYARWTPEPGDRDRVRETVVTHEGHERRWWVEDDKVHVGLPWWEFERQALYEASLEVKQPRYSRGFLPYTLIPFDLRTRLNRVRIAALARRADGSGFPSSPVETGVDEFRAELWSQASDLTGIAMTRSSERSLVLTHDLDESSGWPGVAQLRAVERELGLTSAFGILSKRYTLAEDQLLGLVADGCEIYSHGYLHDGTLAHQPADELRKRLAHFFEVYPSFRSRLIGFRSGQLVRSPEMYRIVGELFDFDLTPPTVELGGPHGWRTGCATTLPFLGAGGLLHIPLSLPQDYFLAFIERLSAEEIVQRWVDVATRVWEVDGTAVLLVHPDNVLRRPLLLDAYRRFLEWAIDSGATTRLPSEVARAHLGWALQPTRLRERLS